MSDTANFGYTQQGPGDSASAFNEIMYVIERRLARVRTAVVVEIMAVDTPGGLAPAGSVDARPLVNQLDGQGNATPHGTIFNLAYFRLQGGTNAVIIDPKVGDKGIAVICDRDCSAVKASKAAANPGSARRFDLADGFYIGGYLNGAPTQVVQMDDAGIKLISPTLITIRSPTILLQGAVVIDGVASGVSGGPISITADINQTGDFHSSGAIQGASVAVGTIDLATHEHGAVQPGVGTSGPPVP